MTPYITEWPEKSWHNQYGGVRYNLEQTIWRLFHVLVQFFFNTSEMEQDYYHQKKNVRVMTQELGFL